MKNLTKIFLAVVAALFAFSCVQDTTEDLGIKVEGNKGGVYEVAVSLEEATKTQLGEKVDGVYPLYWSEGDAIAINGIVSNPLTAGGSASATFQFNDVVNRPFCVVYPAPAAVAVEDEVVEEPVAPATIYPVTFAAVQPYTVGTFAPGVAPMYGYAAELVEPTEPAEGEEGTEGAEEAAIQLNHLTGVLRLAVKGNGEKVTSIVVKSLKGAIAGPHTVDCKNGALTALEGASNVIIVTCGEGLVLGETAQNVYVAVPAGSYGTFIITLKTEAHGKMTVKFNSDVKPINAGTVREFAEFSFMANLADEEDADFIIDSKEALIEFARIASTFYPRTKAVLTTDIDMTGYDWKTIEGFGEYEFDGGNFTIKGLNASLFGSTGATIKNLNLADVNIEAEGAETYGVIAHQITNGGLENCSASGKLAYQCPHIFQCVGGLVGRMQKSSFFGCTNNVDITITGTVEKGGNGTSTHMGGVIGWLENPTTKITDCVNNGTFTAVGAINRIDIGGFIGYCDAAANIENCHNHGELLVAADILGDSFSVLAGFIGCSDAGFEAQNPQFTITNCSNTADVTFGAKGGEDVIPTAGKAEATIHVGGFHGYTRDVDVNYFSVKFTNCTNSGNIEVNCLATNALKISGLLSQLDTDLTMDNCKNTGKLSMVRGCTYTPYIAGFTTEINKKGPNETTVVNITNSSNDGDIYVSKNIKHTGVGTQGGIVAYVHNANIEISMNNVHNNGVLHFAHISTDANFYVGGLIGYQTGKLSLENCSNTKALKYDCTIEKQARNAYLGGIIGYNGASENKLFKKVANSGAITVTGSCQMLMVGGLIGGYGSKSATLEECTNSGAILVENAQEFNAKNGFIGGILGSPISSSITYTLKDCTNSGDITVKNTNFDYTFAVGGISGQAIYHSTDQKYYAGHVFENCTNEGDILVKNSKGVNSHISVGGIIAASSVSGSSTIITNPVQDGDITVNDESEDGLPNGIQIGGIAAYLANGSITNDSPTRGTVRTNISLTTNKMVGLPYVAGIVGLNSGVEEISNIKVVSSTAKPSSIVGNLGTNSSNSYFAGFVGYNDSVATLYENLSNEAAVTATVTTTGTSLYISGAFARLNVEGIEAKNCSTSGDITLNAPTCKHAAFVGGICAGVSKAKSFTSCVNSGAINFNVTTCAKTPYIGGLIGTSSVAITLESCSNSGAITFNPKTSISEPLYIGGIVSTSSVVHTVNNCFNAGDITLKKGAYAAIYLGGAIGYANYSQTAGTVCFQNSYNKGTITLEEGVTSTANIRMAGFCGYHKIAYDTNIANYGDINVGATTTKQILLGGVYGYSGSNYVMNGGYVNTGNITVTGGTGVGDKSFNLTLGGIAGAFYAGIENAINTGNLTVTGDSGVAVSAIGGIVGYNKAQKEIKNCQSYCTIKAFIKKGDTITPYANVGLITGSARAALGANAARTAAVKSCKVGGEIIFNQVINRTEDTDAGGDTIVTETITNTPGVLTADNWFNYIYGGTTDWSGVTGYDGCERLTAAPTFVRLDNQKQNSNN